MQNNNDKFKAILGFAIRADKVVYGFDELKKAKNVKLYALSTSASENLHDGIVALAARRNRPLVTVDAQDLTGKNCKALGITDKHMADGMLEYIGQGKERYGIYRFTEDR